jgi:predicted acetyltransferase
MPYEKCKADLLAFRNANRQTKQDETYIDWRYAGRPCKLQPIIVWAETDRGGKIGSLSLIPHHYMINNRVVPLGVLGDISVAEQWRGRGVARRMFRYLSELEEVKQLEACIVLPNEDAAAPLQKTGWQTITETDRFVKILRFKEMFHRKWGSRMASQIISGPLDTVAELLSLDTHLKTPADCRGEVLERCDERFDDLWTSVNKEGMILGLRNREYLTWRYSRHPSVKYQFFILTSDARLRGYIVYHVNNDLCVIDDLLCRNEDRYPMHLLGCFLKLMRKNESVSSISMRVNKSAASSLRLTMFGFIRRSDRQAFMINVSQTKNDSSLLTAGHRWYLTSGDKDT